MVVYTIRLTQQKAVGKKWDTLAKSIQSNGKINAWKHECGF